MPIHRLGEEPTRRAVLADLTCDSDGKVDQFIDLPTARDSSCTPGQNGEPYYIGVFLVGAYQEILGDLHNLFGDTNAIHVDRRAPRGRGRAAGHRAAERSLSWWGQHEDGARS
jgi:arginine decarboxylase